MGLLGKGRGNGTLLGGLGGEEEREGGGGNWVTERGGAVVGWIGW